MNRTSTGGGRVTPERTQLAVRQALNDVEDAVRPGHHSMGSLLAWIVALGAGGAVLWKSLRAPDPRDASDRGELRLDAASRRALHRALHDRRAVTASAGYGYQSAATETHKETEKGSRNDSDAGCAARANGAGAIAREFLCRFQADEVMTRSQALAFVGVLSLGPILLFALAMLGFAIHDTVQVEQFVHDMVRRVLPGRQASEAANTLIAQTHIIEAARTLMAGKWWAIVGAVLSLTWTAIGLFAGASDAMNAAWDVRESRGFVALRLVAFGVFLASAVLFLLSLVPSALPSMLGRLNLPYVGPHLKGVWWIEALCWLLAVLVNGALFSVVYRFLPNAHVQWKSAITGGIGAGILWELAKRGFAVYLVHFGDYNKLYGALGGAVILVTWIWYTCVLVLAGAIVCKMVQERASEGAVIAMGARRRK